MTSEKLFIDYDEIGILSNEELNKCINECKSGHALFRDKVINSHIALVISRVKSRFKNCSYDKKELVSVGIVGLIKALDGFDIDKNVKFITYATKCIDFEIIQYIWKQDKHTKVDSIDKVVYKKDNGDDVSYKDVLIDYNICDMSENCEREELNCTVRNIVLSLPDRERQIICMYFGISSDKIYNQKEIANSLNISQTYISKIIKRTLANIKQKIIDFEKGKNKTYMK